MIQALRELLNFKADKDKVVSSVNGQTGAVTVEVPALPDNIVQSVNGTGPDAEGNVVVQVGVTSWNDLQDRPFGEDKTVITWDGDATGKVVSDVWLDSASPTLRFVKVSEETFTVDFIKTFSVKLVAKAIGESVVMPVDSVYTEDTGVAVAGLSEGPVGFVVCYESDSIYTVSGHEEHRFPETGVYFAIILDSGEELGYASQIESNAIKQIDPKFIPSSAGGGVMWVTLTQTQDGSNVTVTSSHTGAEIIAAMESTVVMGKTVGNGLEVIIGPASVAGVMSPHIETVEMWPVFTSHVGTTSAIQKTYYFVSPDTTDVTLGA